MNIPNVGLHHFFHHVNYRNNSKLQLFIQSEEVKRFG